MKYSPLFWPVTLRGDTIYILDETVLPGRTSYIEVQDYRQACQAIKQMKTRAVGQVLLVMYAFLQAAERSRGKDTRALIEKVGSALDATRPTLPFKVLTDMVRGWARTGMPLEKCICGFLEALKAQRVAQARQAAGLLKDGQTVLTHCNMSGLLPLVFQACRENGRRIEFIVTETRPYLQGARLTAWELKRAGAHLTLITDGMAAQVMSEGKVSCVITGADHLARNGDIANKIGTYQLALLAKHFNIPFYVVCPPPSSAQTGRDIRIEVRPEDEILVFQGKRIAPHGVAAYYPAFDVTPDALITRHIYMEIGVGASGDRAQTTDKARES